MKPVRQWLDEYGQCHTHPVNKTLHWICVPLIYWSVYALLSALPDPALMPAWAPLWSLLLMTLAQGYYFMLSPPLAMAMLAFNALVAGISALRVLGGFPLWQCGLVVFVLAWVGQFVGHLVEGAKPSFFQDLQFLLIGPLWLLDDLLGRRTRPRA